MSLSGVYSTATYSDTYIMHRCKAKHNASLLSMALYKKSGESQKGSSPQFVRFMLETLVTLCHVVIMDTNKYERVVVFLEIYPFTFTINSLFHTVCSFDHWLHYTMFALKGLLNDDKRGARSRYQSGTRCN